MSFAHARASIGELRALFSSLTPPDASMRRGFFRARFVGPLWLRASAGPSIALGGLPGWQGKRFLSTDAATNVLARKSGAVDALSMTIVDGASRIDGKTGVELSYGESAPFPWRFVRDELRAVDADTMLGMTVIDLPLLRRLAFPFLLEREG